MNKLVILNKSPYGDFSLCENNMNNIIDFVNQYPDLRRNYAYQHPFYPELKFEIVTNGSIYTYNEEGRIHNPYGAAVILKCDADYKFHIFYWDGKNITSEVTQLIKRNAIEYDLETGTFDETAIVTISLLGA